MDDVRPITPEQSTALAVAEPVKTPAPIEAGAPIMPIIPRDQIQAARLAGAIVDSGMVPKSYAVEPGKGEGLGKNAEECAKLTRARVLMGIIKGLEVGLAPMTALGSIVIVNGRPSLWGDGAMALVRKSGKVEYIKEWTEGTPYQDDWTAHCEGLRKGETAPLKRSFSWAEAKRARLTTKTGPWQDYPARMLAARARAWVLRDLFADALSGLSIAEEAQDIAPAPPPVTDTSFLDAGMPAALPTPSAETPAEGQAAAPTAPATGATIAPGAAAAPLDWCPSLPTSKADASYKAGEIVKRLTPCSAEDRMAWFRVEKHAALHQALIAQLGPEHDKVKAVAKLWQEAA